MMSVFVTATNRTSLSSDKVRQLLQQQQQHQIEHDDDADAGTWVTRPGDVTQRQQAACRDGGGGRCRDTSAESLQ